MEHKSELNIVEKVKHTLLALVIVQYCACCSMIKDYERKAYGGKSFEYIHSTFNTFLENNRPELTQIALCEKVNVTQYHSEQ